MLLVKVVLVKGLISFILRLLVLKEDIGIRTLISFDFPRDDVFD